MEEILLFGQIGIPIALLVIGYVAGRVAESRHYQSIRAREQKLLDVPAVSWKTLNDPRPIAEAVLTTG